MQQKVNIPKSIIKYAAYVSLFLVMFAGVNHFRNLENTPLQNKSQQNRILGSLKDTYCSGMFSSGTIKTFDGESLKMDVLVSNDDRDSASSIRDRLSSFRKQSQEQFRTAIISGDFMPYIQDLIPVAAPFFVFGIISILMWFCFSLCCICDPCCPPMQACRRNYEEQPIQEDEYSCHGCLAGIFGVLAIAGAIFGYTMSKELPNRLNIFTCSLMSFYDDLLYGASYNDSQFLGIQNVGLEILKINSELDATVLKVDQRFKDSDWINPQKLSLYSANSDLYNNFNTTKVGYTPKPGSSLEVESKYIQTGLGPSTTPLTSTNRIKTQFDLTLEPMSQSFIDAKNNAADLKTNTEPIKSALFSAVDMIDEFGSLIHDLASETLKYLKDTPEKYIDYVNKALLGIFGGALGSSFIGILGTLLIISMQKFSLRFVLHIGWCLMSVLMILGFILSGILIPIGVATNDACGWMQDFTTKEAEFADPKYQKLITQDILSKVEVCNFGDGNFAKLFNFLDGASQITDTNKVLDDSIAQFDQINLTLATSAITSEIDYLVKIKNGIILDGEADDESNIKLALISFNQWTSYSANNSLQKNEGCLKTQDEWVLNNLNCTGQTIWTTPTPWSSLDQKGSDVCIQVQDFDPVQASERYASLNVDCNTQTYNNIVRYYQSIWQYDLSQSGLFESLIGEFTDLKTANVEYINQLKSFKEVLVTFKSDMASTTDLIFDDKDGLVGKLNCKFSRASISRIYDGLCVAFIPASFKVFLAIGICSFGLFFAAIGSYCISNKAHKKIQYDQLKDQKEHTQVPNDEE